MSSLELETCCDAGLPSGVVVGFSRFGGSYVASCENCGFVCAYWDCACELAHDCVKDKS